MSLELPISEPCLFCEYLDGRSACAFVERAPAVSAFLNPTQYETGALLIVPNAHVTSVLEAPEDLVADVHRAARVWACRVIHVLGATGINVFQNNGVTAGQTVAHYHVHVVPRYPGSDPARRFREAEFVRAPHADLMGLAAKLSASG